MAKGFHAPLDLSDGAARVYDPIGRGEASRSLADATNRAAVLITTTVSVS